jgi:two-component system CheB/CheR fusion protein
MAKKNSSKPPTRSGTYANNAFLLEQIFNLIRAKTRIDISGYKLTTVNRRIQRQMRLHKFEKLKDFVHFLQSDSVAVEQLCDDIFIHVTEFFRDPDSFETLKKRVLSKIISRHARNVPIRIWVPGCSTGEEAYSLAISLLESFPDKEQMPFQIFATDISEAAVEKARAGFYKESAIKGLSSARLKKYFDETKDGYKIKKSIRDACIFSRHDLTTNPPFAKIDLISCRNVLIYFDQKLQKRVLPVFHYSLNANGFLWLGRSETPTSISRLFSLADKTHKIFKKVNISTPVYFRFPLERPIDKTGNEKKLNHSLVNDLIDHQREIERIAATKYAPAAVVINNEMEIVQAKGHTSPFLELPAGHLSNNIFKMLRPELLPALRVLVQTAQKSGLAARKEALTYATEDGRRKKVNIEVVPMNGHTQSKDRQFVVFFEEPKTGSKKATSKKKLKKSRLATDPKDAYIGELLQELDSMRDYQQSLAEGYEAAQEELTSSNEELQSTLEEFQSTNEELETAKEEMQATNEELATVNDELQGRNDELSKSEERFRLLVEGVKEYAIYMLDPTGHITSWNEGARRLKGYERSEVIGRHFSIFYSQEDIQRGHPQEELQLAQRDGKYEEEGWRVRKDGSVFWANVVITRVNDHNGEIFGFSKVTRDLTERKKAEAKLRKQAVIERSEKTLEEIFNSSPSFMTLTIGPEHIYERANQKYYELLDMDPKIIGQKMQDVLPELDAQGFIALLDNAYKTGEPFSGVEVPLKIKSGDGSERSLYIDLAYQPIKDSEGQVYGLVHTGSEVTEKVLARQKLADALKVRDEFLAIASHELKTPLTNLKLQLQITEHNIKNRPQEISRDQIVETLAMSIRQTNSLASLIDDLLEVSRIQTRRFTISPTQVCLADSVTETLARFSEQLKAAKCPVELKLDETIVGNWDKNRIEQIIANLISNALKYAAPSPINISLFKDGSTAVLIVKDSGPGIIPEMQKKIFNRFERLETEKHVGGMGLGLYIVKEIVSAHHGTIELESHPGHGAKFVVKLPLNVD